MQEFGSKDIEGDLGVGKEKSNLTTVANFRKFVEKLSTKASHRQDADRKEDGRRCFCWSGTKKKASFQRT